MVVGVRMALRAVRFVTGGNLDHDHDHDYDYSRLLGPGLDGLNREGFGRFWIVAGWLAGWLMNEP